MIMQKKILIIAVITVCYFAGMAQEHPEITAGRIISYIASLYAPSETNRTAGIMTFGNEFKSEVPDRNFLK